MRRKIDLPWIAILGNPNCGKTAIFNRLTGLHQKVGNYPGITVEQKSGTLKGEDILLEDLPGSYSLNARSEDERIVEKTVQSWRDSRKRPMAALIILDATNLSRSLYLALQVLDWNIPSILVLNMMDEARKKGISININLLKQNLNISHIIPTSARTGEGIEGIISAISEIKNEKIDDTSPPRLLLTEKSHQILKPLAEYLEQFQAELNHNPTVEALRLLSNDRYRKYLKPFLSSDQYKTMKKILDSVAQEFYRAKIDHYSLEQESRYKFIDSILEDAIGQRTLLTKTTSEKLDSVLTHRLWGPLLLLAILALIFNAIFNWAQYPMDLIDRGIQWLSAVVMNQLPASPLRNLLVEGIIAGVGSILIFFPQIILLVFFISLLEDSGYMARMAFMMDRMFGKIGLHGRSLLPLLSGFACAIPAVMASRTIENRRDRLITILIIPLMSCSARLPIYTLLIAAFIPQTKLFWFFSLQGSLLLFVYTIGVFSAVIVAYLFKKAMPQRQRVSLIMELPPYRLPLLRSLWWQVYDRAKSFLTTAGSIIMAISVVLWFLASYPKPQPDQTLTASQKIESSYAGRFGKTIEPLIKPLGYDWKIGIGLISSFAAREVIISTLSTLYNISNEEGERSLITAMREDHYPDGRPVFTPLVALSLIVFFVYAAQCMATFAIVKKETNSWGWPLFMVFYLTALAYVSALAVYQIGSMLGFA